MIKSRKPSKTVTSSATSALAPIRPKSHEIDTSVPPPAATEGFVGRICTKEVLICTALATPYNACKELAVTHDNLQPPKLETAVNPNSKQFIPLKSTSVLSVTTNAFELLL